jgi:mono/diheme cytochrome c family protein
MARRFAPLLLVVLAAVTVSACGDDETDQLSTADGGPDAGAQQDDRVADIVAIIDSGDFAEDGADLYNRNCASCHGGRGQGGIGPQLAASVSEKYAEVGDQVLVVLAGRGGMPAFGSTLDDEQVAAVVDYTRTDLGAE